MSFRIFYSGKIKVFYIIKKKNISFTIFNKMWHNPLSTYCSWSLLCCNVSLLFQASHLRGVGCNLLLQAQVTMQQRFSTRFVFSIVLAGQKRLPFSQPWICFIDVSKVLKEHREENTWFHPEDIISSSFLFWKLWIRTNAIRSVAIRLL